MPDYHTKRTFGGFAVYKGGEVVSQLFTGTGAKKKAEAWAERLRDGAATKNRPPINQRGGQARGGRTQ